MLDFQQIKARVPIIDVVHITNLPFKEEQNGQLRMRCPTCDSGDDRAIVITPDKNLFYCFLKKSGGDQIAFLAHVRKCGQKEAAEELNGILGTAPKEKVYDLEQYGDKLDTDHPAVTNLFPPDLAKEIGAGFAHKGLLRGLVALPIRTKTGHLLGFLGVSEAKAPKAWRKP